MRKKRCHSVKCLETGEVFESVGAAALHAGVKICTMSRHLHGYRLTCGKRGFHYEFVDEELNRDKRILQGDGTSETK